MMSDTYQRIQVKNHFVQIKKKLDVKTVTIHRSLFTNNMFFQKESDVEWKKGRTTLIRNMHRATASPPPINLLTQGSLHLYHKYKGNNIHTKRKNCDIISH